MSRNNYNDIERVHYDDYFEKIPYKSYNFALTSNNNTDFIIAQPANSILTEVVIVCNAVATITSGNIGMSINLTDQRAVGTSEVSTNVIVGTASNILSGGTEVAATTVINFNTITLPFSATARSLFVRITTSTAASAVGAFTLIPKFRSIYNNVNLNNDNYIVFGTTATSTTYERNPSMTHDNSYSGVKLTLGGNSSGDKAFLFHNKMTNYDGTGTGTGTGGIFKTNSEVYFETSIILPSIPLAASMDYGVLAGLRLKVPAALTDPMSGDANQAMFIFGTQACLSSSTLTNSNNLRFVYSIGGTDYLTDLGFELKADHEYHLKICIDKSRKLKIYVNGVQYGLSQTASTTGNQETGNYKQSLALTDNTSLYPIVGIQSNANTTPILVVNYIKLSRSTRKILV